MVRWSVLGLLWSGGAPGGGMVNKKGAITKAAKREPEPWEREQLAGALDRLKGKLRDPMPIKGRIGESGKFLVDGPFSGDDHDAWRATQLQALGVHGVVIYELLVRQIANGAGGGAVRTQEDADLMARQLEEGIAYVQAVDPQSELEAMLAVQMWATQNLTMSLSGKFSRATELPQFQAIGGLFNKTARTFASQVETLQKLRTGGKQQVEVRYVYVDARTQQVFNGVGGGGGSHEAIPQPHAPALPGVIGHAVAGGLPLPCEDPRRDALPGTGDAREEALPDAWGQEPRRSDRSRERPLRPRATDESDGDAPGSGRRRRARSPVAAGGGGR